MVLRAKGKDRVERVSIAGLAQRPTGASAKLWLSHWAKQTHALRQHLRGQGSLEKGNDKNPHACPGQKARGAKRSEISERPLMRAQAKLWLSH